MAGPAPNPLARAARWRALAALGAIGVGFILARHTTEHLPLNPNSAAWFGAALVLGAACVPARGRTLGVLLLLVLTALSAGWFTLRILEQPDSRLSLPQEPGESLVMVEGIVVEPPTLPVARGALARFGVAQRSHRMIVQIRRIAEAAPPGQAEDIQPRWRTATGRLIVHVDGPADAPIGRRIRLTGIASGPGPPTNPGQTDARLWAAQDGVIGTLSVPDPGLIESASDAPSAVDALAHLGRRARAWLEDRAASGLESIRNERARALVASLLLGAEEEQGREITTTFQRMGLAHVLAISGVHIAVLAWATLLGLRLIGDFGAAEPIIAGAAVVLYMLIVPAEAPVLRAGVMVLALLIGEALGRRYDGVVLLAWTAAILLAIRPMDLWSLGFQLSFGVTGVLLGGGRAFHARLFGAPSPLRETTLDQPWPRRLLDSAARAATASLLAWAVASPWIAARVGLVAPLAPISSLIVGVPISLLMIGGFLSLLIGTLVPGGGVVWTLLEPLAIATLALVDRLDSMPGSSMATGSVSLLWGGLISAAMLWLLTRARWRPAPPTEPAGPAPSPGSLLSRARRRCHLLSWLIAVAALAWLILDATLGRGLSPAVALRLDTLDTGDATCHLLRSGDEAWLWDCGSSWAGAGEVRLPGAVRALGTPPVRTAVITHANFDHFNCLPDVAWRLGIRRVLVSPLLLSAAERAPDGATAAMLALLRGQGVEIVPVRAGDRYRLGQATVEFLWPAEASARSMLVNDQSLVARIGVNTDDGWRQVLLTGDIQAAAIAPLLGPSPAPGQAPTGDRHQLRAHALELPHHGAYSRMAAELVDAAAPSVTVQSTGSSRIGMARATDPRWVEPLRAARRLTTATDGAVWIEIRRDGSLGTGSQARPAPPNKEARGDVAPGP